MMFNSPSPVYELLLIFMPKHDLLLTITKCFFFCLNLTRARTRRIIYNLMAKKSEVAKSRNVKEKFTANIYSGDEVVSSICVF